MTTLLYTIIIYPITQIIETAYIFSYKVLHNAGLSIISISVVVSFLCLPLYMVAEKWKSAEEAVQKRLKPKIATIKAAFSGDERFMILQTFYRQNHYHPLYALRNSLGILIQIPFFIAAYSYLSHLETLKNVKLFFIRDLAAPDSIVSIAGFSINLLPILMTAINVVSGFVYTRGKSYKDKIQIYAVAFVFLLLLYNSPSSLVVYWTMNNVFSLVKNIFYRLKNPLRVLYAVICAVSTAFIIYLIFFDDSTIKKRAIVSCLFLTLIALPILLKLLRAAARSFLPPLFEPARQRTSLFFLSCAVIALLTGVGIPLMVIGSSPSEFSFIGQYYSPFNFVYFTFLQSFGFFIFWTACIYFLFNKKIAAALSFIFLNAALIATACVFIVPGDYGTMINTFIFSSPALLHNSVWTILVSFLIVLTSLALSALCIKKQKIGILRAVLYCIITSIVCLSVYQASGIYREYTGLAARHDNDAPIHQIEPVFHLSKNNPNLIIVMADRAINGLVKPIFDEHKNLYEVYDGFTWYPNTISFNGHTLMGVPPVWGGYDFTPREMNRRDKQRLREKHNEALLTLPKLLSDANWRITVTDPSWANHDWVPDTSIYNDYTKVTAFNTKGRYSNLWYMRNESNVGAGGTISARIRRNFLWFALLKSAPPILRDEIYDDGRYWGIETMSNSSEDFINSYSTLDFLPELTLFDADAKSALLITNEITHNPVFLQYPDYTPYNEVTFAPSGEYAQSKSYHINSAFYLRFGEWLELLKENGVYDNTRIIIVSDHGASIDTHIGNERINALFPERLEMYNPVLLVKDFNAHGILQTDARFMTNADVPSIALKNIIENPINPFTGNAISQDAKQNGVDITISNLFMARKTNKYTFDIKSNEWRHVHDDITKNTNWSIVE